MTEAEFQNAVRREAEEEVRKLRARVAELEAALKPFAEFKFGAKSVYRNIFTERGESIVLCGHDDGGNVTGVDVKFSDFMKAHTILSKEVKRE